MTQDGERPFVIGLPEDTLGEVARRVATLGGDAHLIVMTATRTPGTERVPVLRVTECEDRQIGDLDESGEAPVGESSPLAMLMEAITVDQAFYIHDTKTIIRFISDSVQPIPSGSV